MPSRAASFDHFVNAVHRRFVTWRMLERTGLGLLGGSVSGLALLPLALWTGLATLPFVCATLSIGAALGMLWGALRRPTRLESAMQADRQLDLKDLLGTAWLLKSADSGPWAAAVVSTANARCATLTPRSVLLNRLGARAWAGIGLSAAAAIAPAMFFGLATDSRADATGSGAAIPATTTPTSVELTDRPLIAMAPAAPTAAAEHDDPDGNSAGTSTAAQPGDRQQPAPVPDADVSPANDSASPGTGGGSSQTRKPTTVAVPPRAADGTHERDTGRPLTGAANNEHPAGGSGDASDVAQLSGMASAGGTVGNAPRAWEPRLTPPWKSDAWPADVKRAHAAIESGQVPPAYQEMVRQYFDR
jgi:hypothetical protein